MDAFVPSFTYNPEPTAQAFHHARDDFSYRFIRGVPGSGKSVACIMEMLMWAMDQPPYQGVRRTRFAAVRATYPALKSTLIKSWKNWFPEDQWPVKQSIPFETKIEFNLTDGTRVEMEVIFIAVETEEDIKKLKSLELTGGFINEAFEVDRSVVTTLFERTGRYPPRNPATGQPGPNRRGIWLDTNSPHEKHWWAQWEADPPEGMGFFIQPAPLIRVRDADGNTIGWRNNPEAENVRNLGSLNIDNPSEDQLREAGYEYYRLQIPAMTEDQLQVNIENKFGALFGGKPVFGKEWREDMIMSHDEFQPNAGQEVIVGIDTSGFNPAAVFMQESGGCIGIFDEIVALDTDFDTFVNDLLIPKLAEPQYMGCPILAVVDPSNPRNFKTGHTAQQILQQNQIKAVVAPTNDPVLRVDAVKHFMRLRDGFVVHRRCEMLVDGFKGGYHFKKIKGSGAGYQSTPAKDEFAHPQDAVQYGCLHMRRSHISAGGTGATRASANLVAKRYRESRAQRRSQGRRFA